MNKEIFENFNDFRQACKKYGDKKINSNDWKIIQESIYWSPTSHGWEPYRVLTINKDNPIRKELFKPMLEQGIVNNADKLLFFIAISKEQYSTLTPWVKERLLRKAKEVEQNFDEIKNDIENSLHFKAHKEMMLTSTESWAEKQAYIGMSFAMYTAGLLGIDSTPMEGMNKNEVKDILLKYKLISDDETISCALSLGYRFDKTSFAHWGTNKRLRDPWDKKFKEI